MGNEKFFIVEDYALARFDIQAAVERAGYTIESSAVSVEEAIR